VEVRDRQAVREFTPFVGQPAPGVKARFDWATFPDDPWTAFGLTTRQVSYTSPLGGFRAYVIEGRRPIWVLFVHGKRGAAPRKPPYAYPLLPLVSRMGLTSMDITYRNDFSEPASPDGHHWYGLTEWEDLEGAVRFALREGAASLILVGYSMGGSIVTSFLYRSSLEENVRGVILDAPVLNLEAVVDAGVRSRGVPDFLIRPGKWLVRRRHGVDWDALDYLKAASNLRVPILLFHGDADSLIPVQISDRLAALRPDIVTYVRVPGATHGHCWNMARDTYEEAVHHFFQDLT
jgi:pimeloyl-ACP methyl ester carboxylesterase